MKKVLIIGILITIVIAMVGCSPKESKNEKLNIVASFYPMYILTKNIAGDIEGAEVSNMTNKIVGCMHNYTLTTSDLVKLENADVFVVNGLGIENFIDKVVNTYSKINVITATEGIEDLVADEHEEDTSSVNAHVWLSISKYLQEIENVKNGLINIDREHENKYEQNAENYIKQVKNLKSKINNKNLERKKCVSFSEALAYLCEDFNLDIFTVETDHEQNGLSAEVMSSIIEYIKANDIKNIIIDSSIADNNAKTVANETGAKIYIMDSGLNGTFDNDAYIKTMEENLKLVESME